MCGLRPRIRLKPPTDTTEPFNDAATKATLAAPPSGCAGFAPRIRLKPPTDTTEPFNDDARTARRGAGDRRRTAGPTDRPGRSGRAGGRASTAPPERRRASTAGPTHGLGRGAGERRGRSAGVRW